MVAAAQSVDSSDLPLPLGWMSYSLEASLSASMKQVSAAPTCSRGRDKEMMHVQCLAQGL